MLHRMLFPNLLGRWARVNLNECYLNYEGKAFLDPPSQIDFMRRLHDMLGVDYTYGGYLENRSRLLKDQYHGRLQPPPFTHLGMDFNVPADVPVTLPVNGVLVHSEMDPDYDGGWGGKLIFKVDSHYLILGHLDDMVKEKREYQKGEVVAKVGNYPINGNWFPHLHVQCCKELNVNVDGYSPNYKDIGIDFPDPEKQLGAVSCTTQDWLLSS